MTDDRQPSRLHPILAVPLVPFVMLGDLFRWIGRGLARVFGRTFEAIGKVLWWLLTPFRWLFAQLGRGLAWIFDTLLAPLLRLLARPFVWLGQGVAWLVTRFVSLLAAGWKAVWGFIGPTLVAAWNLATRIASAIWRGLAYVARLVWWPFRMIGRGLAALGRAARMVASVIYAPFRPIVEAVAAAGRAVRRSMAELRAAVRNSLGLGR